MMKMNIFFILIFFSLFFFVECKEGKGFVSRPRGFFTFELPEKKYVVYQKKGLPFEFEVSTQAKVTRDTSIFFDINKQNPNWLNIYFPEHQATIYLSYIPVKGVSIYKQKLGESLYVDSVAQNSFQRILKQSYDLVYKHSGKASDIKDSLFTNAQGVRGMFFNISGNTGTKYQFFASDTHTHYLRAVLYFDTSPNEDSLRPLHQYYLQDMKKLMQTLRWKER